MRINYFSNILAFLTFLRNKIARNTSFSYIGTRNFYISTSNSLKEDDEKTTNKEKTYSN